MKFLAMIMMLCAAVFTNAQTATNTGGGLKVDKNGVTAKGAKGGAATVGKKGASAKSSKGKGVEADKKGTRSTPATK